jgi:hypothetical protein
MQVRGLFGWYDLGRVRPGQVASGRVCAHGLHTGPSILGLTLCPVGHHTACMDTATLTRPAPSAVKLPYFSRPARAARKAARRLRDDRLARVDDELGNRLDSWDAR